MRHSVVLIIAIIIVITGAASAALWLVTDRRETAEHVKILPAPQQYDTTGGQEMRPRWNSQEDAGNATTNN
jgi:Ti type entry exclusion protein TrbK